MANAVPTVWLVGAPAMPPVLTNVSPGKVIIKLSSANARPALNMSAAATKAKGQFHFNVFIIWCSDYFRGVGCFRLVDLETGPPSHDAGRHQHGRRGGFCLKN